MRTACLSIGLKERNRFFVRLAAAVIRLGVLKFAVRRESWSAVVCIVDVWTILLIRKFFGINIVTLSDNNLLMSWTLSDTDR